MSEILLALVVGGITGFIFAFFKLPIPAPGVFSGIIGIAGIYGGAKLFEFVSRFFV